MPPTAAARPKRAAEEFARAESSKKPRFDARNPSTLAADAPEDDLILDADVIGKSGAQTKRNAVNIDGYDSDSDNDNFNARAAQRDKEQRRRENGANGVSKDVEDDDMFADADEAMQGTADGDDDEELVREGKKRKDVKFLDEDVEGEDKYSKSGGHVSARILQGQDSKRRASSVSSSSDSGDEEERDLPPEDVDEDLAAELGAGHKKKHAPRLDAFNLRDEQEEGKYDESGNFVRKAADPDAVNDRWLEGLSKKDMKKAKEAQEKRDQDLRRKDMENDAVLTSDLLSTLIQHLEVGETPLEALQRLNKSKGQAKDKKGPKWKQKKQGKMDIDETNGGVEVENSVEESRKQAVDAITGAADALYSRKQPDIYEAEREILMRQYKRETGNDWTQPMNTISSTQDWEYRWSDARDGGEHHGPYDAATMKAWNEAGYFGEGVEFRQIGGSDWSKLLEV